MKCPVCKLENPEEALRCDCGYDFASGRIKESYLAKSYNYKNNENMKKPSNVLITIGWISAIMGGALGILIGYIIAYSKNRFNKNEYAYEREYRESGKKMMIVGIIICVLCIVIRAFLMLESA